MTYGGYDIKSSVRHCSKVDDNVIFFESRKIIQAKTEADVDVSGYVSGAKWCARRDKCVREGHDCVWALGPKNSDNDPFGTAL